MGKHVKLTAQDGQQLDAYVAQPEGTPRGAIVVVQEIFGVNAHIRSIVDGYASEGYTAIAPALFDRYEPGVELKYEGEDMQRAFGLYQKLKPETALLDVAAGYKYLETEGAKKIAVVGFCYGGFMAWISATRGSGVGMKPVCTVGYYPGGVGSVATEQPACPVMLHFGKEDTHIGEDQITAVREAHPEVKIFEYEGAQHGFNCDARGSFNPDAAKLARGRTLEFLKANLG